MKLKNYLLLSGIALFAISCSNNDDDNNQEMTLKRVEEYYPSKEAYDDVEWQFGGYKDVKYYENGEVVLDSFFDSKNSYYSREVIQTIGNTKVRTRYNIDNIAKLMTSYEFDSQGRLIQITTPATSESSSDMIESFVYNTDGTITNTIQQPQFGQEYQYVYATNAEERIIGSMSDSILHNELIYQNGNITSIDDHILTYYDIKKPSNLRMNIIQANNYLLEYSGSGNNLGTISDNYIKTFENDAETFESTFNDSGYIVHTNWSGIITTGRGTKEFFYYYN